MGSVGIFTFVSFSGVRCNSSGNCNWRTFTAAFNVKVQSTNSDWFYNRSDNKTNWFSRVFLWMNVTLNQTVTQILVRAIMFTARFKSRLFHLFCRWQVCMCVYVSRLSRQPSESTICRFTLNFICICPITHENHVWIPRLDSKYLRTHAFIQPVRVNSIQNEWFMLVTLWVCLLTANEEMKRWHLAFEKIFRFIV